MIISGIYSPLKDNTFAAPKVANWSLHLDGPSARMPSTQSILKEGSPLKQGGCHLVTLKLISPTQKGSSRQHKDSLLSDWTEDMDLVSELWDRVLKVYPVTFLTSTLNQSMQVLKWLDCLMIIPISEWLQIWGLSIVNFTDSWDFVVVRSFLSSRWSVLLSFWRQKATL